METLLKIVQTVNMYLSDYVLVILLIGAGLYFTIRTKFVQVRCFGEGWRRFFGEFSLNGEKHKAGMSSFQALATAVAAQVGTGNIVGACGAILIGGPGAIFWMWFIAFFGMATIYAEAVLAQETRVVEPDGTILGGPVYYIKRAFPNGFGKFLAGFFAVAIILALGFMGSMVQSNSIGEACQNAFHIPSWVMGLIVCAIAAFIFIGGVKRIGAVAGKVVPAMAVIYVLISLIVIILHIDQLPRVLAWVVAEAFTPTAAEGGFAGATVMMAIRMGMARGVFSNEAGLGTAPMAHAAATSASPLVQASIGMLDTFIDTIIVCTMTGFAILVTGQWTSGLTGAAMTSAAFETSLPGIGGIAVTICLTFFAFTTALGWCVYGERCAIYFFGDKAQIPFRIVYCIAIPVGVLTQLDVVWLLADTCNALMAIPNLIAILLLSPVLFKLVKEDESKDSIFKH